ncbi:Aste57867_18906 [Aphanomyces stellatus]|uniref:Aste57867_18906 protein n=1 Tax=Aphanomyces stellatus TaxID=120398 RepID=A0A485LD03_9STRA|nr:hypothetical protein As57867_018842 [Aphanomyces stellatus]VFT95638.1 Aste57867_18906 [Aphanomyces stellatus]
MDDDIMKEEPIFSVEHADDPIVARKRRLRREKMQRYRKRLVDSATTLRAMVSELEEELGRRSASLSSRVGGVTAASMLPWKEIAEALRDVSMDSTTTHATLKRQVHGSAHVLRCLWTWTEERRGISMMTTSSTWRDVTLLMDPFSRHIGFDWITLRMFNNVDCIFDRCAFPSIVSDECINDFVIDTTHPEFMQYVWRRQFTTPLSLDTVSSIFNLHLCHKIVACCEENQSAAVAALRPLDQAALQDVPGAMYSYHRGPTELVNILTREFCTPTRRVVVTQNIIDDERLGGRSPRQANRQQWLVLQEAPRGGTIVRYVYINSQDFTAEGYVPFEEEAKGWGVDGDAVDNGRVSFELFAQHARTCAPQYVMDLHGLVASHVTSDDAASHLWD